MHRQSPQMASKTGGETLVTPEDASSDVVRLVLFAGILIAAATLITLIALGTDARSFTVFDIPDLQGLEMKNWVTGRGFGFDGALFTGSDDPIWMRCARMPLPIWTIAGLRIVFGSGMIAVNLAKVCSVEPATGPELCPNTARLPDMSVISREMGRLGRRFCLCRCCPSFSSILRRCRQKRAISHRPSHSPPRCSSFLAVGCRVLTMVVRSSPAFSLASSSPVFICQRAQ